MNLPVWLQHLPVSSRILSFVLLAVGAHLVARTVRWLSTWALGVGKGRLEGQYPRFATITTLVVSIMTFVVYFAAIGLILQELGVPLKAYFASASVIGLAVGFGLQGLVQDLIIGLTLIFSDVLNVGDMVDLSGQSGRVATIGLRFTTVVNFQGQEVYVPNRNITQIGRYRNGVVRAYVDVQLPEGCDEKAVTGRIRQIAAGMHTQHGSILLSMPEVLGAFLAEPGGWRYVRLKCRLWPGQGALIEQTFKQRLLAALRETQAAYDEWMITVTYGVD